MYFIGSNLKVPLFFFIFLYFPLFSFIFSFIFLYFPLFSLIFLYFPLFSFIFLFFPFFPFFSLNLNKVFSHSYALKRKTIGLKFIFIFSSLIFVSWFEDYILEVSNNIKHTIKENNCCANLKKI